MAEGSLAEERIGFIGLGLMGHGMAKNLVEKGYPLTVLGHRNRAPVESLLGRGATEARSAAELAAASSIVILCVTGSREVEALVRGPGGLGEGLRPGSVVIDTSTSDPLSTRALAAELRARDVAFADAPLSRTPKEAEAGTLDTMVGCDQGLFNRIEPVLRAYAAKVVRVGEVGDGHAMKLVNNFVAMSYAALYSEALVLARKAGLRPEVVDGVLRGSRMDCGFYQTFMSYVLERNRDAHRFTLTNASKDMRYVTAMGDALGVANPIAAAVKNGFAVAVAQGRGQDYVPMLSDVVANLNGTSLVD